MSEPHAICDAGRIFWRGSDPNYRFMMPQTARNLLDRGFLPQPMLDDLAKAIAEQNETILEHGDAD